MWHTPCGDRVVDGAEAKLLKEAMHRMVDLIQEERADFMEQTRYGIVLFDELPWTQRLALLDRIATYLFTSTPKCTELTAVTEAAVAAVFQHVEMEIELEEEDAGNRFWQGLVNNAYTEAEEYWNSEESESDEDVDDAAFDFNEESASCQLEVVYDRILWDADFDLQDEMLDAEPCHANMLKQFMGIDADYFADVAPDVTENHADEVVDHLVSILRSSVA